MILKNKLHNKVAITTKDKRILLLKANAQQPGMVVYTYNPST